MRTVTAVQANTVSVVQIMSALAAAARGDTVHASDARDWLLWLERQAIHAETATASRQEDEASTLEYALDVARTWLLGDGTEACMVPPGV